jgi:hypothetical protein
VQYQAAFDRADGFRLELVNGYSVAGVRRQLDEIIDGT